jgi:ketosteroid isomerase-like protein
MQSMKAVPDFLENWLRLFARSVRNQDMIAGKKLFQAKAISFGTVCPRSESLDELVSRQWQVVWPNTRDFDFEYDTARAIADENLAVLIAGWKSTGFGSADRMFSRSGRATIVLGKTAAGWQAVHSHFSIKPTHAHDPIFCQMGESSYRPRVS